MAFNIIFRRFLAFLLDILILDLIVAAPFRSLLNVPLSFQEAFRFLEQNSQVLFPIFFFMILFSFFYFVIMEYLLGQTVGKMLLDLKVVSNQGELSLAQVILRSLFLIPVFPFTLLWIMDPFFMFIITKNRRFSEIISNTRVRGETYAK